MIAKTIRRGRRHGAVAALLVLWAGASGCGTPAGPAAAREELVRAMNQGIAHLENRESAAAIARFEQILAEVEAPEVLRNLARARLVAQDAQGALADLRRAAELDRHAVATRYLLGIAHARLGEHAEAVPHLEAAVAGDAQTAALRYQLGAAYHGSGRHDEARAQFDEALRLDPLHFAAVYRLSQYAAAAGDREGHQRLNQRFQRLRAASGEAGRTPEELEACRYTRPEPLAVTAPPPAEEPPAIEVRFAALPPPAIEGAALPAAASAAAVLDLSRDGGYTIAAYLPGGGLVLLAWDGDGLRAGPATGLPARDGVAGIAAANFHDVVPRGVPYDPDLHAHNDLLLYGHGGVTLLARRGPSSFADVTAVAGIGAGPARCARWLDAEHDGDLDVILCRDGGLELWLNRGDGTFTHDDRFPAGAIPPGSTAVAAADLDADVAVDLVVAHEARPAVVLAGRREGRFAPAPFPRAGPATGRRVLVDDLDGDRRPDLLLFGAGGATVALAAGGSQELMAAGEWRPTVGTLFDYDNDGWLDVALAGEGGDTAVRLWRNLGPAGWRETSRETGLSDLRLGAVADLLAADVDGDGDSDLVLAGDGGVVVLRNDGGDRHRQLKLRLVGLKTNPLGYGTRVEVAAGSLRVSRVVDRVPLEIGVGDRAALDAVQTVWTNGVVDNQIDIEVPAAPLTVLEKNVATGSCPFLYVRHGGGYRFVTDLLGNAPLGLSLRRGEPLPSDPDELVLVGPLTPGPDGLFRFEVTSELREVQYFDQVRLVAVTHPAGTEAHATDKLVPPPFPPSEVWALRPAAPLLRATAGDGADLTGEVASADGFFAPPGTPLPPPLRGATAPRRLLLDFGPLDVTRPLVLALTGWLQYGDASTNIALSQSEAHAVVPPRLEAEAGGRWVPLDVRVGMPAGKTKTILTDLSGRLPPGAHRLRLTTTFEIRWDRVALFTREPDERAPHSDWLGPRSAELGWHGFSPLAAPADGHPTIPDHGGAVDRPPWRTALEGWSTRYGDVLELVAAQDGRLAIVNSGDVVRLAFDAAGLPPLADGWRRTWFFYSVGWNKDGDHNVVDGDTVEPLPAAAAAPGDDWELRYNTRWVPRDLFAGP